MGARVVMLVMLVPMIFVIWMYDSHPLLLFGAMPVMVIAAIAGDRAWRRRRRRE